MKPEGQNRSLTFVVQRDGTTTTRTFRLRLATFRAGVAGASALFVAILVAAALYIPVARAAARVPGLEREVERLTIENDKVRALSIALDSLEQRYAQVRQMIGADIVRDPVAFASALRVAPAVYARILPVIPESVAVTAAPAPATSAGPSVPRRWPLDEAGYITRGQVSAGQRDEPHPGVDIAVPKGSLVRAAGGGAVKQAGQDPEYGTFVLLEHPEGYQTMYGHLSRAVAAAGQSVAIGEVVGLSGNTGRSTAPHLHFEIRRDGHVLDPLTMITEGR